MTINRMLLICVGGAKVGEGTFFYDIKSHPVDETSLAYIEIGRNCRITRGAFILAHDYSYAVLRPVYHNMVCKAGVTKIGDNVFLGINSLVLMGATIGDNVVVGAGSVVSGNIPPNVVIGGNPAKIICSLEDYYKKNLEKIEDYARIVCERKANVLQREIHEEDMGWYNQLWDYTGKDSIYRNMQVDGDSHEEVVRDMMSIKPKYASFKEFVNKIRD